MNFIEEKIKEKGNLRNLRLRFPPEPNGHLHIGHAKSICLNFGLAEKFGRPCNLRFDDTNPAAEDNAFVESIKRDIEWLGFKWDGDARFTSDYFKFIYACAVDLISKGLAYVDDSTSEEIATMKGTPTAAGVSSPYRSRSVTENMELFAMMRDGDFAEGSRILRAKIDMSSPNMLLRDPVIYRIIEKTHHHTGDAWKIYPMYDFAHPLSDYYEGITDSLCTLEFEAHRPLYNWVLDNLDFSNPLPEETEFARLNIDHTVMSKRKLKRLVDEGHVSGWDDPRMPTISGLRRRGYTAESIREFCDRVGVTRHNSSISDALLEECLRIDLNNKADRMMGVMDPVLVVITNWSGITEMFELENNPGDESAGTRMVPFSGRIFIEREDFREVADSKFFRLKPGGEVRLKGAYVIKAEEVVMNGDRIAEIRCTYDPMTRSGMHVDRKVKGTIHWVSAEHCVRAEVREYGRMFPDVRPEDNDGDFLDGFDAKSLTVNNEAVFEPAVSGCVPGVPVQMLRTGYYVRDTDADTLVFNRTVSLKEDRYK